MITKLSVRNYKSLRSLDLPLRPLTVFVGANGSGKSNIIDSLMLQQELTNMGSGAIESRGGFKDLVWDGDVRRQIEFHFEGTLDSKGRGGNHFQYDLELTGSNETYRVASEGLRLVKNKHSTSILAYLEGSPAVVMDDAGAQLAQLVVESAREPLLRRMTAVASSGMAAAFPKSISIWKRYEFTVDALRQQSAARREVRLSPNGSNLAALLHTLQTELPERFERLKTLLRVVLPEMIDLYAPLTEQGKATVRLKEQGLRFEAPLWVLSVGTLHTLAVLAALYAPEPPDLMCFEEPENYVHPRVLDVLAETFREVTDTTQVLITTHSPHLLNLFEPEDVVIVEKENGATIATAAKRRKGVAAAMEALGAGAAWYSGAIGGLP